MNLCVRHAFTFESKLSTVAEQDVASHKRAAALHIALTAAKEALPASWPRDGWLGVSEAEEIPDVRRDRLHTRGSTLVDEESESGRMHDGRRGDRDEVRRM